MRCIPTKEWRVVPRNVKEDEPRNSEDRTSPVHTRSVGASCKLGIVRKRFGNCDDREDRKTPACESVRPEKPGPPRQRRKDTGKQRTDDESPRRHRAKKREHDVLLDAGWIRTSKQSQSVWHDQSSTYALHSATHIEEDVIADVRAETCKARPDS